MARHNTGFKPAGQLSVWVGVIQGHLSVETRDTVGGFKVVVDLSVRELDDGIWSEVSGSGREIDLSPIELERFPPQWIGDHEFSTSELTYRFKYGFGLNGELAEDMTEGALLILHYPSRLALQIWVTTGTLGT